jgi:Zn-dependent peptidase ImmA (M78 family)
VRRPIKWKPSAKLTVHPDKYNMAWIHGFICKSLRGSKEIRKITIKENLRKLTGYCGLCVFEDDAIIIAHDMSIMEQYISVLHEIFHYYFRDYHDIRLHEQKNDPVEERAEKSAQNVLQWYICNGEYYQVFKMLYGKLKLTRLTKEELEDLTWEN